MDPSAEGPAPRPGHPPVNYTRGPDTRGWGGGYWWQNTREPYYNALVSGDVDLLQSLYPMYLDMLPLLQLRNRLWFDDSSDGGFFPETATIWGTYRAKDYGWCHNASQRWFVPELGRRIPVPENTFIRYHIVGGLELVNLLLRHHEFAPNTTFAQSTLLPVADTVLAHYGTHWPKRDARGKIVMMPSQALETHQCEYPAPGFSHQPANRSDCVTNPTPDVAGLRAVVQRMLALPATLLQPHRARFLRNLLEAIPELPSDGSKLLAAASVGGKPGNSENPALYAVYPFKLFDSAFSQDTEVGVNTYRSRPNPGNVGWRQDLVDAAVLGLRDEAMEQVIWRAGHGDCPPETQAYCRQHYCQCTEGGWRWPGFAQGFQDYAPSLDHFSWLRTAVHEMLLRERSPALLNATDANATIALFAGLPPGVDASFKLHGPNRSVIEGRCEGGQVASLHVSPAAMAGRVAVLGCGPAGVFRKGV